MRIKFQPKYTSLFQIGERGLGTRAVLQSEASSKALGMGQGLGGVGCTRTGSFCAHPRELQPGRAALAFHNLSFPMASTPWSAGQPQAGAALALCGREGGSVSTRATEQFGFLKLRARKRGSRQGLHQRQSHSGWR